VKNIPTSVSAHLLVERDSSNHSIQVK